MSAGNIWRGKRRDPFLLNHELATYRARHPKLFPDEVPVPEVRRGEIRLAAEVVLASGRVVLPDGLTDRARVILTRLANEP